MKGSNSTMVDGRVFCWTSPYGGLLNIIWYNWSLIKDWRIFICSNTFDEKLLSLRFNNVITIIYGGCNKKGEWIQGWNTSLNQWEI